MKMLMRWGLFMLLVLFMLVLFMLVLFMLALFMLAWDWGAIGLFILLGLVMLITVLLDLQAEGRERVGGEMAAASLDDSIHAVQQCLIVPSLCEVWGERLHAMLTTLQEQRRLLSRGDSELMREGITFLLERSDELEIALIEDVLDSDATKLEIALIEAVLDSDATLPAAEIVALRGLICSTRAYARCLRSKI